MQSCRSTSNNASVLSQYEGSVWRALGIMTAAGGLRNAALLLRELRMPDAAAAFCAACKEAGFHSAFAAADAGALLSNVVQKSHTKAHHGKEAGFRSTCIPAKADALLPKLVF